MFGNFNLNAGLSQLQDLGGRFQKIKEDLEQNIESSLRTNVAPAAGSNLDQDTGNIRAPADGTVAFGGTFALPRWCCIHSLQAFSVAFEAVRLGCHCKHSFVKRTRDFEHMQIRGKAIAWVQLPPRHPPHRYFCHMHAMHQNMLASVVQSSTCRRRFADMPCMLSCAA